MSVVLFLAAAVVRLAALAVFGLHPDTLEYERQARSLLAGEGYRYFVNGTPHLALGPPLYGFLCAGLYHVWDSPLSVLLIQIGASALIPVVIARIAREIGMDRRLQWVAALPAVVHPGLIVYAVHKLHPLSLDALLLSLTVLNVVRLASPSSRAAYVRAGLTLGLTTLSRGTVAMFAGPAAAWLVWIAPERGRRRAVAGIAVLLGVAALVILPWTVRNYIVFHRFVFITTDTAELFWRGNNPVATGSANLPDGRRIILGAPEAFRRELLSRDELGQFDLFRETAFSFVREHPREFVGLLVRKWVSFWWFPATSGLKYPHAWLLLYAAYYVVLLTGAILGVVAAWRRSGCETRQRLVLVLMMLASISVAQSIYYVEVRHRWGVEALLGIFAAAAVSAWPPGRRVR